MICIAEKGSVNGIFYVVLNINTGRCVSLINMKIGCYLVYDYKVLLVFDFQIYYL